jgi:putative transposase
VCQLKQQFSVVGARPRVPTEATIMPVNRLKEFTGPATVFVSTTVIDWAPILTDKTASITVTQLAETATHFDVSIAGYVLMPSHLHAILGFKEIARLSKFMQSFKSLSSRTAKETIFGLNNQQHFAGDGFTLWKRRFDDLIIESKKQFSIKLEYIHDNPVRAGLVKSPTDWVYSSAKDWLTGEKGIISIDKGFSWLS